MNKFLKVFASLLWWSFECRFALLLWESDLNTWVTFWEAKVDQIFNENHVKDQAQVDLVVLGFLEYANTWWHKVCKNYDRGPPAASWMDIKTLIRARFVPPSYRKELLLKLQRLHQGSMSVSEHSSPHSLSKESSSFSKTKIFEKDPVIKVHDRSRSK